MSDELISILVLVLIFLIGTTLSINMGVLGIVAAFVVGTAMGVSEDDIFLGFPGDLFVILVGVTYLFGIASMQRDGRLADPRGDPGRRRPDGRHPVGLLPRDRHPHRIGRGGPGRGRHHRPDRAGLRRDLRHQPGADGPVRHQRRHGGRLLADQRVRLDRQRRGGAQRAGRERDAAVRLLVPLQPRAHRGRVPHLRRPRAHAAARWPSPTAATRPASSGASRRRPATAGDRPPMAGGSATHVRRRARCPSSTATRSSR